MRTTAILQCLLSSVLFTACLDANVPDDEPSVDETAAELGFGGDLVPVPICGDLHETFQAPQSCNLQGHLGLKDCTQSCTIHRAPVWNLPPPGISGCTIVSSDCSGWSCGPCVIVVPQGPLG